RCASGRRAWAGRSSSRARPVPAPPSASRSRLTERAIIRVFLADDHPVVRQGLRTFLESRPGIEVVGEAGDGDAAVDEVARLRPDVVLMDLVMPGGGGVVAIRCIRERAPETRVVVLTSFASDDQVIPAVQAGAARGHAMCRPPCGR